MDEQQRNTAGPRSVFISYAHEDEPLCQRLEAHLSLLRRQGWVADWHDRQIMPGAEWAQEIDEHLETASIILLLISPDFLASDYCYEIEMQRALERHKRGEAWVTPIILRPCDWQTSPFASLQSLPRDGKAVTTWQNMDEAFLAVAGGLRRVIERQQMPIRPLPDVERKNRANLIKRVRTTWIKDLLEHSLHEAARLELHLQEQPDVLASSLRLQVQELDRPPQPLPAGTSIVQMYDEADGELLILGEPGTGKTTLLLELARTLLDRAEADERHRIPVVFNLSSWAQKRPPLSEWLIEGLTSFDYHVPRKIAQSWVVSDQILPLLDGLDEVADEARVGCVQAINTYFQERIEQREQGSASLVVCCRIKEYTALRTRVNLHQAVNIQPLTQDQIDHYLQSAKGQLEALRQALQDDAELHELARRPLMLSIFTLAYQGAAREDLPAEQTREAQQQQVFAFYIKRMLERRSVETRYIPQQTIHWLSWLAWQMKRHNQTEFYLERMQPSWLPHGRGYLVAFSGALIVGIALIFGLLFGISHEIQLLFFSSAYDQLSKLVSWLPTLSDGLIAGLIAFRHRKEIKPAESISWSWRGMYQGLKRSRIAKILGIFGVLLGVLGALSIGVMTEIESVFSHENIPWFDILAKEFLVLLATSSLVIPYLLLLGILNGWFNVALSESSLNKPNQGMRNSARYSLLVGSLSGLIIGLTFIGVTFLLVLAQQLTPPVNFTLQWYLEYTPQVNLSISVTKYQTFSGPNLSIKPLDYVIIGLFGGMWCGLIVGVAKGGFACIQHIILRLHLLRARVIPWNYPRFLDYAAERILLRKVGGGYIFVHRLLLEYFASQVTTVAPAPQQQNPPVFTYSPREGISSFKRVDTPPAISGASQSDTAHQEEKASPTAPSRKTGFNKGKLFVILFAVVILLLALVCNVSIFSVVQQSATSATAQIEATATVVALVNASPIPYPPQHTSPVLNDPLQDNSKGNSWDEEDTSNGGCKFIHRAFDLNINAHQLEWCIARATDFTNFIYEVQMKIVIGDAGGIAFRIDPTNEYQFYYFAISQDGSYSVQAISNGEITVLVQGSSSAIHQGLNRTNLVAAVVHGKIIELYVNLKRVAVVIDSTYTHGQIGVIASGFHFRVSNTLGGSQTEVIFQNAKVWKL